MRLALILSAILIAFCSVSFGLTSSAATSAVKPLLSQEIETNARFTVQDRGHGGMTIDVDLPPSAHYYTEEAALARNAGKAPAMFISRWIVIPNDVKAEAKSVEQTGRRVNFNGGQFPEYIDYQDVEPGAIDFERNDSPVFVGSPYYYRGMKMVPVLIEPVQFNENNSTAFENRSLSIELDFAPDPEAKLDLRRKPISRDLARILNPVVLNLPHRDLAPTNRSGVLIVYPELLDDIGGRDDPVEEINAFAEWKRRVGFQVSVEAIDAGQDQDDVASDIIDILDQREEDDNLASVEFLIIMGHYDERVFDDENEAYRFPTWVDPDDIEMKTDNYLVMEDHDSYHIPDVIIGRFICSDFGELEHALHRSMRYEQDPPEGEWLSNALYTIATPDLPPWESWDAAHWAIPRLLDVGYDNIDTLWNADYPAIGDEVLEMLEDDPGYSLAIGQQWLYGAVLFEDPDEEDGGISDIADVGANSPFVITNAEHYSSPILVPWFNSGREDDPNGPVAGFGSWIYPVENRSNQFIDWSVYAMRYMNEFTGGYLFHFAGIQLVPYLEIIEVDEEGARDEERIRKIIGHLRYLGDPTLQMRNIEPQELTIDVPDRYNVGATLVSLQVASGDDPISGATVCIRQAGVFQYVSESNGEGWVYFTIPEGLDSGENLQITATKHNYTPFVDNIDVADSNINIVFEEASTADDFVNGSTVGLNLTLRNAGGQAAQNLIASLGTDSPYLEFSREEAPVENIAANETGGFSEDVELTLDPDCPGGAVIQIRCDVRSGNIHWEVGFELTTMGPNLAISNLNAQNIARGRNGTIAPELHNIGDVASTALQAELISRHPAVIINQAERNYAAVNPDSRRNPDGAFGVRVEETFIPGQTAQLELRLSGDNDYNRNITFEIGPVGEPRATDPLGPDEYGYVCFDNYDEGWRDKPTYRWYEINPDAEDFQEYDGEHIIMEAEDDFNEWDEAAKIELPFAFQHYGVEYDSIIVSTNGWISVGTSQINRRTPMNWRLPGIGAPKGVIAPCWIDIDVFNQDQTYEGIYYHYIEEEEIFVVEWYDVKYTNAPDSLDGEPLDANLTFQVLLRNPEFYPTSTGDGEIIFQYYKFVSWMGNQSEHPYPLAGISNHDGTVGLTYSWRENDYEGAPVQSHPIEDSLAVLFTPDVAHPSGLVRGRVVRFENEEMGVPGVMIDPLRTDPVITDENGNFVFNGIRPGIYPAMISGDGFNTISDTFEVELGQELNLPPYQITHPTAAAAPDTVRKSLRPDESRVYVQFALWNEGNGVLEYETEIRDFSGNSYSFDPLWELDISYHEDIIHREDDIIYTAKTYGPAVIDSLIYIPVYRNRPRNNEIDYVVKFNWNGEKVGEIANPIDSRFRNLTTDGEQIWGSYFDDDYNGYLARFDVNGNQTANFAVDLGELWSDLPIVYNPDAGTIFLTEWGMDIYEYSIEGEVVRQFPFSLPGHEVHVDALGWYPHDPDGMYLYMLEGSHLNPDVPDSRMRLFKMNPQTGDWKHVADIPALRDISSSVRGMTFLSDFNANRFGLFLVDGKGGIRDAEDILRILEFGPNISLMVPNSFRNFAGVIEPGVRLNIGFEVEANAWDEGIYRWSYLVTHNAAGDDILVPVELEVDNESDIDGKALQPNEFALQEIYPNPFNNIARINFSVDKNALTAVKAYDLNGRLVSNIYEDTPRIGAHTLSWDASELPSGMYVIRLESEGRYKTKKIVLMK